MTLPLKNFMASLPDQILSKLRPHQVKPVEHLLGVLGRHQSAVDASGTGTGKTWVAAAVIAVLRLPALVVTPFIAQTEWRNVLTAFGDLISLTSGLGQSRHFGRVPVTSGFHPTPDMKLRRNN